MTMPVIGKPEASLGTNSCVFAWPELGISVHADRLDGEGTAELSFYHANGATGRKCLHIAKVNLLSSRTSELTRLLTSRLEIDWQTILTYVTGLTMEHLRRGEPLQALGKQPVKRRLEYQLYPILEENQPTTLYAPGGTAKSYLCDYIATLVQFGAIGFANSGQDSLTWVPRTGNVLYLDWESTFEDHERRVWAIKAGLRIEGEETFLYRRCSLPLTDDIYEVQRIVADNHIVLVVVDSQMAAGGSGPDQALMASQFYNSLRTLGCTCLVVDHVNRIDWQGGGQSLGPYGSVVKFNRSRAQFELQKTQDPGDTFIDLAMHHRKFNEGKLLAPIGIRITFVRDENENLDRVDFTRFDVSENATLSKKLSVRDQLKTALDGTAMTIEELAQALERPKPGIYTELYRNKALFVKLGDKWQLHTVLPEELTNGN